MNYLLATDNVLTAATGYVPRPGSVNARTSATKSGGGVVSLTGGAIEDATYDIEILNNTIVGTPTVSAPTFVGVGNPVMSGLSASSGVAAQLFAVTLTDLGTDTEFAQTPFQGVRLKAKTAGADGNNIVINVVESGIVRTGTSFALLQPLTKDANEYVGEEWNFGAPALNPDGTIPASAPRISFGDDPQVYREFREFVDGRYVYRFSPAPVRDVAIGARVKVVTGSRTVTTFDGDDTRTYNTITTLYSLLNAIINDSSRHVDVDGVVTVDNRPGGMGVTEMSVRTVSYVQSLERDGSQFVQSAELVVTVTADAPTEILDITCARADVPGAEVWTVRGSVSGELADAVTNIAYDGDDYDFTIPQILPPGVIPPGEKSVKCEFISRATGEGVPALCFENFVLGANAIAKTYRFTWTARTAECDCSGVEIEGGPDDEILGVDVDTVSDLIPTDLQSPLQSLYTRGKTFIGAQATLLARSTAVTGDSRAAAAGTALAAHGNDGDELTIGYSTELFERVTAVLKVDRIDIQMADEAVRIFHACARNIFDTTAAFDGAAATEWAAALTQLETDFAVIDDNDGGDFLRTFSAFLVTTPTTVESLRELEASHLTRLVTSSYQDYMRRYEAWMDKILVLASVEPDFDGATRGGNHVWQDEGHTAWWVSQDGLCPLQNGIYYHSCAFDDEGVPVADARFGIGVNFGCAERLKEGDILILEITPNGSVRTTYQPGDRFSARIIKGAPLPLGGGQTGTDTQTWRVQGSTVGPLDDYALYKPLPVAYSDGGLEFLITPGGIDSVLGDKFEFYIEGGQFRHRKNGGAWSAATQIAASVNIDTASGATIAAAFLAGEAPSWVIGDTYAFSAKALHTLARITSPAYGGDLHGTGILTVPYTAAMLAGSETTALFVRNESGESRTFYLTVLSLFPVAVEIAVGDNYIDVTDLIDGFGSGTELKVTCGEATGMRMGLIWLGKPFTLSLRNGVTSRGVTRKRIQFGNAARETINMFANIQHVGIKRDSFDDFADRLNDAVVNHGGRFAVAWNSGVQSECGIVEYVGTTLDVEDEFDFQQTDGGQRLLKFAVQTEPAL